MNIIIFGIGGKGKGTQFVKYSKICKEYCVVAAIDNIVQAGSAEKWFGIDLFNPNILEKNRIEYDRILITAWKDNNINDMKNQLIGMGVLAENIWIMKNDEKLLEELNPISIYDENTDRRVGWLKNYARFVYMNGIEGSVAECGVFQGDFSMYINTYFSDRELYLFDTFEGFDEKDIKIERELDSHTFDNSMFSEDGFFSDTSDELVLKRMPNRDKCVIKKGYFPESAIGCENVKFCFVNLDMDLYQPELEGLRFFWPRMVNGGVILLHDYFHSDLPNVKKAVDDFNKEMGGNIPITTIGDNISIAIIKNV